MYPELIRIGGFVISSYGVLVTLGVITGYLFAKSEFKRKNIPLNLLQDILFLSVIFGVLGAKLMYIFENIPMSEFLRNPLKYLLERAGLTWYGAFLLGLLAPMIYLSIKKANILRILDAISPSLAIGYAIGRIGCFLVGDDYGVPTNLPWGMEFPRGAPPTPPGVKVHPTQIYETLIMTGVFLFLWKIRKKEAKDGKLFGIYLILSGIERFGIEFIRTTTPSFIPGISIAQIIAFFLILIGLFLFIRLR